MYAAVPRMAPACVSPIVTVGDCVRPVPESPVTALARPKSSTLTMPSDVMVMFAGAAGCDKEAPAAGKAAAAGTGNAADAKTAAATQGAKHECKGKNECKGQGGCKVEGKHDCKAHNACKGQGGCKGT